MQSPQIFFSSCALKIYLDAKKERKKEIERHRSQKQTYHKHWCYWSFLAGSTKKLNWIFSPLPLLLLLLTSRNSKGCFSLKPLFLSAIKCHCLETWALSSGIHLTYMHIIKWESNINKKGISDHKRRKKGGGGEEHMTTNTSPCQFHSLPLKLTRAPGRIVIGSVDCIYH